MNLREYNDKVRELLKRYDALPKCDCADSKCPRCLIHKEIMDAASAYLRSDK